MDITQHPDDFQNSRDANQEWAEPDAQADIVDTNEPDMEFARSLKRFRRDDGF